MGTTKQQTILRAAGAMLSAVLAATTATISATWQLRGVLADHDRRLSVLEAEQASGERQTAESLAAIHEDLRQMRDWTITSRRANP